LYSFASPSQNLSRLFSIPVGEILTDKFEQGTVRKKLLGEKRRKKNGK
jgi:hypothetical protein